MDSDGRSDVDSEDEYALRQPRESCDDAAAVFAVLSVHGDVENNLRHVRVESDVTCFTQGTKVTTAALDTPYTATLSQTAAGLFLDPTGTHCLVSGVGGELLYINVRYCVKHKIQLAGGGTLLAKQSGYPLFVVEAVGWDGKATTETSTGSVLIGSARGGLLYQLTVTTDPAAKAASSTFAPLYENPDLGAFSSIALERFGRRLAVIATTRSQMLVFTGPGNVQRILEAYRGDEGRALHREVPCPSDSQVRGTFAVFRPTAASPAQSFAWASSTGVWHGVFKPTAGTDDDPDPIQWEQHIPFGKGRPLGFARPPHDIALSGFHMYWLYDDKCLVVNAPPGLPWRPLGPEEHGHAGLRDHDLHSRLRYDTTRNRRVRGLQGVHRDVDGRKVYIHSSAGVWEVSAEGSEAQGSWRLFAECAVAQDYAAGMRRRFFSAALKLTAQYPSRRDGLAMEFAKFHVGQGDHSDAAEVLVECNRFEEVLLFLYTLRRPEMTVDYLQRFMGRLLDTPGGGKQPHASQLVCLMAHVLQLMLEQLAEAEQSASEAVQKQCAASLLEFLLRSTTEHQALLDDAAFYSVVERMLAAHARIDALLSFAERMQRFRATIAHYVNNKQYAKACNVLVAHCNTEQYAELWYEFSPALVQHCPCRLFDGLCRGVQRVVGDGGERQHRCVQDPVRLIPALNNYDPSCNEDRSSDNRAIEYLEFLVQKQCATASVLWDYLVGLVVNKARDDEGFTDLESLLRHDAANYTAEYALRKCLEANTEDALNVCVYLYCRLGLVEDAVRVALAVGKTERAKELIELEKLELGPVTVKKLWCEVADVVMRQTQSTRDVLAVVEQSDGALKLEDVLHTLTRDNTVLQEIKTAICDSLDSYTRTIDTLKEQMQEATNTASRIKAAERALSHQFGYVTGAQRCDLCRKPLLRHATASPFVIYPACRHAFHESCVTKLVAGCGAARRAVMARELGLPPSADAAELAAVDCPACGEFAITEVVEPYFACGDAEDADWAIGGVFF